MVDLKNQYLNIKQEIDLAIKQIIDSGNFISGNEIVLFQNSLAQFIDSKHVVACANGTDALQIAIMALGLKPGDEIITPAFTFIATAEAIALLGLKPVFAEIDKETFNIDVSKIEQLISQKTKAIIPVHLFGQCADMEQIMKIAIKHNLFVIEDSAQAIATKYYFSDNTSKTAGTIGNIGTTSFFPSKNLGCFGDGGALFTQDDFLKDAIKSITNHGAKIKYYHDEIGVNSRLDTIQAAVLSVKLKYLNQYIAKRKKTADFYNSSFANHQNIIIPKTVAFTEHTYHQYTIQLVGCDRDKFREYLQKKDIPAMIYYPVPIHLQKAFSDLKYKHGDLPVTENISKTVISLPMHTELDSSQLEYISENVLNYFINK